MMDLATLADLVVAHLNAVPKADKPFDFVAKRPKTKAEVLAEGTGWRVFVVPSTEDATPVNHDDVCDERLRVKVITIGPCKDLKEGLRATKKITRLLRRTDFADPDPEEGDEPAKYRFQGTQTIAQWDDEAIEKGIFASNFEAEFYGID